MLTSGLEAAGDDGVSGWRLRVSFSGASLHGLAVRGDPLFGLSFQGRPRRGPHGGVALHGRGARGGPHAGVPAHGRALRGGPFGGLPLHGRETGRPLGFARSRHESGLGLCGCELFLNRSRGSRWSPPGLQSRPRFSSGGFGARCAACAASGDSQSRPRANHFITTSAFVRRSCCKVGRSSSRSRARKAVGFWSMRIVQYA